MSSTYTSKYANGTAVDAALDKAETALQAAHVDTDVAPTSLHHTLGTGANQAAQGSHTHTATAIGLGNVANQTQQFLHGFPERTATTLAFDNTELIFTLGVATTATVYIGGIPYTIASPGLTIDLDSKTLSVGLWYIWAEVSGGAAVLNAAKAPWSVLDATAIPVATVYWNGTEGALGEERHSCYRDLTFHKWAHDTVGSRIVNDGSFAQTYPAAGNDGKIQLVGGSLFDEDLSTTITTAQGKLIRNWYETAAGVWTFADGTNNGGNDRPYIWNSGTSRLRYPKSDNSYALTDAGANDYMVVWCFASNDVTRPLAIVSQAKTAPYTTLNTARAAVAPAAPLPELKLLYKWIFRGDGTYVEATDYRTSSTLPGGGVTSPPAIAVSFAPAGAVASTNVQQAIEELDAEKLAATGGTIGSYIETGATLTPVAGVLTIPLDGRHYSCTPTADITSIVLSGTPTMPLVGQASVYFNYSSAARAIASPTAWYWPDKLRTLTATKSGYIVRLDVWSTPAGNICAATNDMGVPA